MGNADLSTRTDVDSAVIGGSSSPDAEVVAGPDPRVSSTAVIATATTRTAAPRPIHSAVVVRRAGVAVSVAVSLTHSGHSGGGGPQAGSGCHPGSGVHPGGAGGQFGED